jgi:tRNA-dihydrouridine synthase
MLACLDALVDLITVHGDVRWRRNTNAHLVAIDAKYDDLDIVANADGFADAAGEDEHAFTPKRLVGAGLLLGACVC